MESQTQLKQEQNTKPIIDNVSDDFDFEGNREGASFLVHMTAGSVAGLMEHVALYPMDTIKVSKLYIIFFKFTKSNI
jgi:hypothetical protein